MELLMVVALLSCLCLCLAAVLWRRASSRRARVEVQQPTIEISDPAVAQRALIENATAFSNRPLAPFPVALVTGRRRLRSDNIISAPYGPHWRALTCSLTSELIHPSRLGFLAPLQRAAAEGLLAGLSAARGQGDVVVRDSLYAAVFALVARMCFGDGVGSRDVRAAQHVMQEFVLGVGQSQAYAGSRLAKVMHWRRWRRLLASRGKMAAVFFPIIKVAGRQTCGGVRPYVDSLLDLRVPDHDAGADARRALTDDEMVSLMSEFLGAGTETVVACVEWTLAHLMARPEVQDRLSREVQMNCKGVGVAPEPDELRHEREMPYLHAVVLESLRLHPPVPFLMRDARAEDGAAVVASKATAVPPAGLRVHFMLGAIGRDSDTWTDPHSFRPERFLPGGEAEDVGPMPGPKEIRMMPFGAGRRSCPGMGLAMVHVKLLLAALVRDFQWAGAGPGHNHNVDLTELDGLFKTMKNPLRARITARHGSSSFSSLQ